MGHREKVTIDNYNELKTLAKARIPFKEKLRLCKLHGISQSTLSKVGRSESYMDYRKKTNGHLYAWQDACSEWQNMSMTEKAKESIDNYLGRPYANEGNN